MKFPTKVRYSLRLLIEIKNSKEIITLQEASNRTHISENYLKQLASTLEKNGILKGKKGPNGGYIVTNYNISLKDLVDIFSDGVHLAPCIDENYKCELIENCPTKNMWHNLNKEINKLFGNIKLKDF